MFSISLNYMNKYIFILLSSQEFGVVYLILPSLFKEEEEEK